MMEVAISLSIRQKKHRLYKFIGVQTPSVGGILISHILLIQKTGSHVNAHKDETFLYILFFEVLQVFLV